MRVLVTIGIAEVAASSDLSGIVGEPNNGNTDNPESVGLLQNAHRNNMHVTELGATSDSDSGGGTGYCCHSKWNFDGKCKWYGGTWVGGRCSNEPLKTCVNNGHCNSAPPSQNPPTDCYKFKSAEEFEEDCTNKPLFEWQHGRKTAYKSPTYVKKKKANTLIGSDSNWRSEIGSKTGKCVAYVKTKGKTCEQFCNDHGKKCAWAQDDAHHQTDELSDWLSKKQRLAKTKCTLLPREETGCDQEWQTQICACE